MILTKVVPPDLAGPVDFTLALTAEQRTKVRQRLPQHDGQVIHLQLPRGTTIALGTYLQTENGDRTVLVTAEPEPVLTVRSGDPLKLLQGAYHLGNRHVPLEMTLDYLRLSPDPVLADMLHHLGLQVTEEIAPFQPVGGAYQGGGHHHHHH